MISSTVGKAKRQQLRSPAQKKQTPPPLLRPKSPSPAKQQSVFDLADRLFGPRVQRSFPVPQRVTPRSSPASEEAVPVDPPTLKEVQHDRVSVPDDQIDRLPTDYGSLPNQWEAPDATLLPPGCDQDANEEGGADGSKPYGVSGENEILLAPQGLTFSDSGSAADGAPRSAGPPATPATSFPRTRLG